MLADTIVADGRDGLGGIHESVCPRLTLVSLLLT